MKEALIGFLGVIVGSFIPWIKEAWVAKQSRKERAKYLAVRVICVMDELADNCIDVVQDDGTVMGQASERDKDGQEYFVPVAALPTTPSFPDDIDWQSIDDKLMYRILTLPNKMREANSYIEFIWDAIASPPDYDDAFEARWEEYSKLGLEAMDLAAELRSAYDLPVREKNTRNPNWNPREIMETKLKEIEEGREAQAVLAAPIDIVETASEEKSNGT